MKLIKCRKCGTTVTTDTTLMESLIGQMKEYNEKARNAKSSNRKIYIQQAAQLSRIINQIQHRETVIKERSHAEYHHLHLLKKHLVENNLMTYEEIDEIREKAKMKSEKAIEQERKEILRLYGEGYNLMSNRANRDDTARTALKKTKK